LREEIFGVVTINVKENDPATGKPYLQLTFQRGDGQLDLVVSITTNLAEMIGSAGAGVRERWEDRRRMQ
jgi:hypothetical protein